MPRTMPPTASAGPANRNPVAEHGLATLLTTNKLVRPQRMLGRFPMSAILSKATKVAVVPNTSATHPKRIFLFPRLKRNSARLIMGFPGMDSAKLNDWMQVIGIFALVASLIFVGLQMKQTQEIALSDAYQSRAAIVIEMVTANAANENGLAAWFAPDSASIDALSPVEVRAGNQMPLSLLLAYDNMLFQHENGFISDEGWAGADPKRMHENIINGVSNEQVIRRTASQTAGQIRHQKTRRYR
jgi:hypothetical protein